MGAKVIPARFDESNKGVQLTRLSNGLTVLSEHIPHVESFALGIWIDAGSRHEGDKEHGAAHLLEHMAFKGTPTRNAFEITHEIEQVGGEINAMTDVERTTYYIRALKQNLPETLNVLCDIVSNTAFEEAELLREKAVVLQEIAQADDIPDDLLSRGLFDAAYDNQPIARSILGTPKSIQNLQSKDIINFKRAEYTTDNMIVAASGNIDHEHILSHLEGQFEPLRRSHTREKNQSIWKGGEKLIVRPIEQVHIAIGFEGFAANHDNNYALTLFSGILGGGMSSRLFQEAREKRGLCYGIEAMHLPFEDTGLFGIFAATSDEDTEELLTVIIETLNAAIQEMNEEELSRAKAQVRAMILMAQEDPMMRATRLAQHMSTYGEIRPIEDVIDTINAISLDEVMGLARQILLNQKPAFSAVGDIQNLDVNILTADRIMGQINLPKAN